MTSPLVPVVVDLVRPINVNADVRGLNGRERCELDTERVEV